MPDSALYTVDQVLLCFSMAFVVQKRFERQSSPWVGVFANDSAPKMLMLHWHSEDTVDTTGPISYCRDSIEVSRSTFERQTWFFG